MDHPFDRISPLISPEEALPMLEGLDDALLKDFYQPLKITPKNDQPNSCDICLDLSSDRYKSLPKWEHHVHLYQLHISARQGCIACLIIVNEIMSLDMGIERSLNLGSREQRLEEALGKVTITRRPGYVPQIASSRDEFSLFSAFENGTWVLINTRAVGIITNLLRV